MKPYIDTVSGTIGAHGGKSLVNPRAAEAAEGGLGEYPLKVIIVFPSMAAAKAWYNSAGYQAVRPYRTDNSTGNFIWLEGVWRMSRVTVVRNAS